MDKSDLNKSCTDSYIYLGLDFTAEWKRTRGITQHPVAAGGHSGTFSKGSNKLLKKESMQ